jgi:hypothetical protein
MYVCRSINEVSDALKDCGVPCREHSVSPGTDAYRVKTLPTKRKETDNDAIG